MGRLSVRRLVTLVAALAWGTVLMGQTTHQVTRIVDGDTLVLSELGIVRLIGVDTPETVDPRRPVAEFGKSSSSYLSFLTLGKKVRVEYDQTRKDRYGRTLAYLYLTDDGRFVNQEIVRMGYGHVYTKYPFKFMEEFRAASKEAQLDDRGLWAFRLSSADISTLGAAVVPLGLLGTDATATTAGPTANASTVVYTTQTGKKYHLANCRSLSKSRIPMTLSEASPSYGACEICQPPVLVTPALPSAPLPVASAPRPAASPAQPRLTSQRCAATTQKGARCLRTASAGSAYCWQHGIGHQH